MLVVVLLTSPIFRSGSLAAASMASAIFVTFFVSSEMVSAMAPVRSLVFSRRGGVSAKTVKAPAAVTAQKTRHTSLLILRSFLLNLRGL